jgi:ribosomal protein S6--L-glutamate ligase
MLEGTNGPKILEINSSPGLEVIERASGIDVASAIVQHAERFFIRHRGHRRRRINARISDAIEQERVISRIRPPRARQA